MQNDWQGEDQYLEAGKKLTQYQVERLGKIWALLNERGDHVQDLKKDKGCVFVPRCSVGRPAASEKVVVKKPACQKKMAKETWPKPTSPTACLPGQKNPTAHASNFGDYKIHQPRNSPNSTQRICRPVLSKVQVDNFCVVSRTQQPHKRSSCPRVRSLPIL